MKPGDKVKIKKPQDVIGEHPGWVPARLSHLDQKGWTSMTE